MCNPSHRGLQTIECERWPDEAHLYAATMADPCRFKPDAHFHYAGKLPWIDITDRLPKHPGSADLAE